MKSATTTCSSEAEILHRVIKPHHGLSAAAARALLRLDFDESDRDRMHALTVKNQEGKLSDGERTELESYRHVGMFLDLVRAKARLSLKVPAASRR